LRHYNLVDAKIEETIDAHPGATVCGLDYHPKKEVMVTSSTDGTAKFWVPSGGRAFE
jgi:WD40 repeat protein